MCVGVTEAATVGEGGGFGECVGAVGAIDSTGGGMNVCVALGVGGGASTEIVPRPDRSPSVAVTVAEWVATYDADAEAGVLPGIRSENDEPETFTVTVTSVRLANRTHPPVVTSTDETSRDRPCPCAIVMLPHDAA